MNKNCLFCRIICGEIPADIVVENQEALAFKDIHPQAPTHLLIIPKQHTENICSVQDKNSWLGVLELIQLIVKDQQIEHFRVISNTGTGAGQSVFHLHFHLLSGRKLSWPPG